MVNERRSDREEHVEGRLLLQRDLDRWTSLPTSPAGEALLLHLRQMARMKSHEI